MNQETAQLETPQAIEENMEHHPTNDEIEEYEESQRKFRELWEKKREKVSLMLISFLYFIYIRRTFPYSLYITFFL